MAHIRIDSKQRPEQRLCHLGPGHTLLHDLHSSSQFAVQEGQSSTWAQHLIIAMRARLKTTHALLLYCQQGAALTFSAVAGSTSGYICSFMEMSCETKPAAAGAVNEVRNVGGGRTCGCEQSLA